MLSKHTSLLEWVEKYPKTENIIREYDEILGVCLLCQCLFESIVDIEGKYQVDLDDMYLKLIKTTSDHQED